MIQIKVPKKTILCVLIDGFSDSQIKSLTGVIKMVKENGGMCSTSLEDVANYLNKGE